MVKKKKKKKKEKGGGEDRHLYFYHREEEGKRKGKTTGAPLCRRARHELAYLKREKRERGGENLPPTSTRRRKKGKICFFHLPLNTLRGKIASHKKRGVTKRERGKKEKKSNPPYNPQLSPYFWGGEEKEREEKGGKGKEIVCALTQIWEVVVDQEGGGRKGEERAIYYVPKEGKEKKEVGRSRYFPGKGGKKTEEKKRWGKGGGGEALAEERGGISSNSCTSRLKRGRRT